MKTRAGFTLIEVVLVIVLTGILSSVIAPAIMQAALALHYDQTRTAVVSSCRVSMDRLGMEIRRIRSYGDIAAMAADNIAFTDVSGNAIQAQVVATAGGNELRLTYNGFTSVLSTMVDQFGFMYLDADGQQIDPADGNAAMRLKTVRMIGRFSPVGTSNMFDNPYDLTCEVRPPNLGVDAALLP